MMMNVFWVSIFTLIIMSIVYGYVVTKKMRRRQEQIAAKLKRRDMFLKDNE
jgi:hypothetical protein